MSGCSAGMRVMPQICIWWPSNLHVLATPPAASKPLATFARRDRARTAKTPQLHLQEIIAACQAAVPGTRVMPPLRIRHWLHDTDSIC